MSKIWKKRRAAHVRCRGNGLQNCLPYWPLCHDHIKENANRNKQHFKICGWNNNQEVDIHQTKENLINNQTQIDHENDQLRKHNHQKNLIKEKEQKVTYQGKDQLQNQNQHIHQEQQDQLINNQELDVQQTKGKASNPDVDLEVTPDQEFPQNANLWPSIPKNINTESARVTLHKDIAVSVEFDNQHYNIYAGGWDSSKDFAPVLDPLRQEYDTLDKEKEKCSEKNTDGNEDDKVTNNVDYVPSDDFDNDIVTENIEVQEDDDSQTPQRSNIIKALMTKASILWPSRRRACLSKTKANHITTQKQQMLQLPKKMEKEGASSDAGMIASPEKPVTSQRCEKHFTSEKNERVHVLRQKGNLPHPCEPQIVSRDHLPPPTIACAHT